MICTVKIFAMTLSVLLFDRVLLLLFDQLLLPNSFFQNPQPIYHKWSMEHSNICTKRVFLRFVVV